MAPSDTPKKKAAAEKPKPQPKRARTGMCIHRNPPETFCSRCDK